MGHALHLGKSICGRIVDRNFRTSQEGVALNRAANHQDASIRQGGHPVAEHVPGCGLGSDRSGLRIPERRLQALRSRRALGARDHHDFAVIEERGVNHIRRHQIRQSAPRPINI